MSSNRNKPTLNQTTEGSIISDNSSMMPRSKSSNSQISISGDNMNLNASERPAMNSPLLG